MDRTAAREKIRSARVARGVSYEELGKAVGTKDPTYSAAALHGQHRPHGEESTRDGGASGSGSRARFQPRPKSSCSTSRSLRSTRSPAVSSRTS